MSISLKLLSESISKQMEFEEKPSTKDGENIDIAVIGLACRIAGTNNKEEFWHSLKMGEDWIRPLPENRQKLNEVFLNCKNISVEQDGYYEAGFLEEVDKFDRDFFGLSPLEANLMSPNQRLFLETAWSAIEDAGYGGGRLCDSKTGVFLGHSTDFGTSYREYIETIDSSLSSISISGNINSTIASRISYLLNLKGPSLVVDTACSSSLVAVHMACRSIRNGECEMAIAGSVKIDLLPLNSIKIKEDEIGITSVDGRARTFDSSSDGTGLGEGVGAILLKPLSKALADGDNIYAVIKGSAINQDGRSVGLTAPNPLAQSEVILSAWEDAGIDPQTISYIEAHGTGTKLGDPIEINGISQAFHGRVHQKQFCGIGSVKTNIGHLDHAAGIASLIKVILALHHKEIPPTIHFKRPNPKINFEESPVYVNNSLRKWEQDHHPRRCGVSAFGISGTNCHIVLEEAPSVTKETMSQQIGSEQILCLSAKSKEGIQQLIWQYQVLLHQSPNLNLGEVCATANVGRGHYSHRLSIVFKDRNDLIEKLEKAILYGLSGQELRYVSYNEHRIVSERQTTRKQGEITQKDKMALSVEAMSLLQEGKTSSSVDGELLEKVGNLYVRGAELNWELLYEGQRITKLSLPTYPFAKTKCWIESPLQVESNSSGKREDQSVHPLLDRCLASSFDRITYVSKFSCETHWILSDHKVARIPIVPGTAYLEMVHEAVQKHKAGKMIRLEDVVFLAPLEVNEGESKEVQTILHETEKGRFEFTICSKTDQSEQWIIHVKGSVLIFGYKSQQICDIAKIKESCSGGQLKTYSYRHGDEIETGDRWDCIHSIQAGIDGVFAVIDMNERYREEIERFYLHPALLDEAANVALRSIGEDLYLPFAYKKVTIYDRLPTKFYSYVRYKNEDRKNPEVAAFDITLIDPLGNVLVEIEDYMIKKVNKDQLDQLKKRRKDMYFDMSWKQEFLEKRETATVEKKCVLIFKGSGQKSEDIVHAFKKSGLKIIEVELGSHFSIDDSGKLVTGLTELDYSRVLESVKETEISYIVHLQTLSDKKHAVLLDNDLIEDQNRGVNSLFRLMKALAASRFQKPMEIILVSEYAHVVNQKEEKISPLNAAFFGLGKVIHEEFPKVTCRCIDLDDRSNVSVVVDELTAQNPMYLTAYRDGDRYVQELITVDFSNIDDSGLEIKEQGVYIITGGTGGIGLETARYLSTQKNVHLVLTQRSEFPSQETWTDILNSSSDQKLKNKIAILKEIQSNGSTIHIRPADVSNKDQLSSLLHEIRQKFGKINGVFHGAGVAGDQFIVRREKESFNRVISPKVLGTWLLHKLTENDTLDFFVMFSSITSLLAGAGQGDYTAANCFLDSFTSFRNRLGLRTLTINWPAWNETGMAVNYQIEMDKDLFYSLTTKNAIAVLDTVLRKRVDRIIVGELNYQHPSLTDGSLLFSLSAPIKEKVSTLKRPSSLEAETPVSFTQVTLTGREENEYSDLEKRIAGILSSTLGLEKINVYENFLDMGGNSILAVKVELEMENHQLPIKLLDLYEFGTVNDLARYVERKLCKESCEATDSQSAASAIANQLVDSDLGKSSKLSTCHSTKVNQIKPFNDVFYKDCFHNSLFPVLTLFQKSKKGFYANDIFFYNFNELSLNENSHFFERTVRELLQEQRIGVRTKCHRSAKQSEFTVPVEDIRLLETFSRQIAMDPNEYVDEISSLVQQIRKGLLKGNPIIIWVDCFHESIRKDTFKRTHWMHSLLLTGFNDDTRLFTVFEHDSLESLTYKERFISYDDLVTAYEGFVRNYAPYANMPTYYEFFLDGDNESGFIDESLERYQTIYRNNVQVNKNKIDRGIDEVWQLRESIFSKNGIKCDLNKFIPILNYTILCKQIEKFSSHQLWGGDSEFTIIRDKIFNLWNSIRIIMLRYHYTSRWDKEKMESVPSMLEQIYQLEKRYYKHLGI
ncbi:SDR family NAD(P)-dependent oxidoreductase [Brevibacillus sp. SAFN-007a]|uniref:SDR family NAD(P)-dependent oxidoreductase n=1 Tax=Brevibacillus sp. SAFN-007a TaxID=3436862 RepID=UPI003F7DC540